MDALCANLRAAGFDEMEGLVGTIAEALMERGEARGPETRQGRGVDAASGAPVWPLARDGPEPYRCGRSW